MSEPRASDALERAIGSVLNAGSMLSTALLAVGLAGVLLVPDARANAAIISAGLIILLATPVARVIVATVGYALQKEWLYAGLAAIVLLVLGISIGSVSWR